VIGFLQHVPASFRLEGRFLMQQLAEMTGGQAFFPISLKDLDAVYDRVAAEIAGQYTLGYQSSNARADGTWRKVEIKLARPGLKGAKLRTRAGYYAPYREDKDR
jgi:VWFA-related protein